MKKKGGMKAGEIIKELDEKGKERERNKNSRKIM